MISRFTPGLRLPTYLAAGLLRTSFPAFAGYFLLAAAIWTPLLVGATAFFGARFSPGSAVLALCVLLALPRVPWRRLARWEFWPVWMAYLPLLPWWLWLAARYRSLTVFTLANPGIPSGGLKGESKSAILSRLPWVPAYTVVRPGQAYEPESYPVVCKPDTGERGRGVAIVRTRDNLRRHLNSAVQPTIVQQYVGGEEFGVFYYRYPGEATGRIFSITRKVFPSVAGDGRRTIAQLIDRDARASRIAAAYLSGLDGARVPARGERVALVEIGSHCRGNHLPERRATSKPRPSAEHRLCRAIPPRFLLRPLRSARRIGRCAQEGRFRILELNGVSAEATHIYDPAVSIWEAYRVMFQQWPWPSKSGDLNQRQAIHIEASPSRGADRRHPPAHHSESACPAGSARPQCSPRRTAAERSVRGRTDGRSRPPRTQ